MLLMGFWFWKYEPGESVSCSISRDTEREKWQKGVKAFWGLEVEKLALSGWLFKENGERERERERERESRVHENQRFSVLSIQCSLSTQSPVLLFIFFVIHLYYYIIIV